MKILVTVSTFYPRKDGVQAVTEYLTKGLAKKGHEITIITSQVKGSPEEENFMGMKIIRVPVYTKYGLHFGDKKEYQQLILKLAKEADVLVNVCTQTALTDLLYPILAQIKCKKILHMHGMYDFSWHRTDFDSFKAFAYKVWRHIRWGWLYFVNTKKFKQYDCILQLHHFDDGYIFFKKHYGVESVVLENAADSKFYCQDIDNKKPYAICVSNYIPRKNQEFLLKSFYKSNAGKDMELILIGSEETSYYKYLQKLNDSLQKKCGSRKVKLLIGLSREKTIEYVKNASIYLMGSTWEAFSISLIEAMAAGTVFLSTDVGVARYLPGGVICNNEDDMAYWLDVFNENIEVRKAFSKAASSYYVKHLTIDSKVDLLENVIKKS